MSGRYIDANALKEQMLKYGFHSVDQTVTEFVEDTLPTADAVEVVRCKHCEYHNSASVCKRMNRVMKDDEFCSYGERRKE